MTEDPTEDPTEETLQEPAPMKVEITNQPKEEIKDNTSWETEDPLDVLIMTEADIKDAEESRYA